MNTKTEFLLTVQTYIIWYITNLQQKLIYVGFSKAARAVQFPQHLVSSFWFLVSTFQIGGNREVFHNSFKGDRDRDDENGWEKMSSHFLCLSYPFLYLHDTIYVFTEIGEEVSCHESNAIC